MHSSNFFKQKEIKRLKIFNCFKVPGTCSGNDNYVVQVIHMILYLFVATIIGIPLWYLTNNNAFMIGNTICGIFLIIMGMFVHDNIHSGTYSWLENTMYASVVSNYHYHHHIHPGTNFNILFWPLTDFLYGTIDESPKKPTEKFIGFNVVRKNK